MQSVDPNDLCCEPVDGVSEMPFEQGTVMESVEMAPEQMIVDPALLQGEAVIIEGQPECAEEILMEAPAVEECCEPENAAQEPVGKPNFLKRFKHWLSR